MDSRNLSADAIRELVDLFEEGLPFQIIRIVFNRSQGSISRYLARYYGSDYPWRRSIHRKMSNKGIIKGSEEYNKMMTIANRVYPNMFYVGTSGYIHVHSPSGSAKDCRGYIQEHRLVAEEKIGRELLREEVVHHKNHIRDDNRPCNLEVMGRLEHLRMHGKTLIKNLGKYAVVGYRKYKI